MYLVELINDEQKIPIHDRSVSNRKIKGKLNVQINSIDSFTFTISQNNHGYDAMIPFKTNVSVTDMVHRTYEFRGRILKITEKMDANGTFNKDVICESELGYLNDSLQTYGEYHNITIRSFLQVILDRHNQMVDTFKRIMLGTVTVEDNNDSIYRFIGYEDSLTTIKTKLLDKLGGEIQLRYDEKGVRYLDYLKAIGIKSSTEIRIAKNLKTITEEKDPLNLITRLIPLGAKIASEEGKDSEERIDIKSVNGGKEYIDDLSLIQDFGIISKSIKFDDIYTPSILLNSGNKYMQETNRLQRKFKISTLDLSVIGMDLYQFQVGNYYRVINPLMRLNEDLRVIAKSVDINSPQLSTLTIGDKFDDFNFLYISQIQEVTQEIKQKVSNEIYNGFVKKVVQELTPTSLTTTISEGLQSNDSIRTSKFSMDIDGFKIYNTAGDLVIFQDAQTGDLKIVGDLIAGNIDIQSDASIGNTLRLGNLEDASIPKFILFNGNEVKPGTEYHGNFIGYMSNQMHFHGEDTITINTLSHGGASVTLRDSDLELYATDSLIMNKSPVIGSDRKFKKYIKSIHKSDWILDLEIKEYDLKKEYGNAKHQLGIIANDYANKDYADLILSRDKQGRYAVNYNAIFLSAVDYIKTLEARVKRLEERVNLCK